LVAVEVVVFDSVVVVVEPPAAGVVIAEGVSAGAIVLVDVEVVAVPVAVVPVSSTTVGCSVVVVVSVVVSSFFLQPVTSAVANTATRPRVTSFFISLISFFLLNPPVREKIPVRGENEAASYRKSPLCQPVLAAPREPS
jgi:hypothetical protein